MFQQRPTPFIIWYGGYGGTVSNELNRVNFVLSIKLISRNNEEYITMKTFTHSHTQIFGADFELSIKRLIYFERGHLQ